MKVVAAYLLAVLGGKTSPSAADLKDILGSGNFILEKKSLLLQRRANHVKILLSLYCLC